MKSSAAKPVRTVVIGAGTFGAGIIEQAPRTDDVRISAVAEADLAAAKRALLSGGATQDGIRECLSRGEALAALEAGQQIITADASILFDLPVDLVVEATGVPAAGAAHAAAAISAGKHVAMVTKEADAVVGPILKYRADRAGVVYTAVDGDQHGLLMRLARWARRIGFDVLCGGKALDCELIIRHHPDAFVHYGKPHPLTPDQANFFAPAKQNQMADALRVRRETLGDKGGAKPWDLTELTIAANATSLSPDIAETHCPALWTSEIPSVLCPKEFGGILDRGETIDAVQVIRHEHEATLGGGVFVVVHGPNRFMRELVSREGMIAHPTAPIAMLMWPHHLLGIEAINSIVKAAQDGIATGARDYEPRFDVIYIATRDLPAGTVIGDDHSPDITARIIPARALSSGNPLPAGLARGTALCRNILKGDSITLDAVSEPADSFLWNLRREQDTTFNLPS